jgi:mannose-1-phosphate guanylyltransferase
MYAVIMAGGRGTRFWPRSREKRPKQLLNIVGRRSMLQQTVRRIGNLVPRENILVVTGASHGQEVREQLAELPTENIILEPVGRNTSACIGLAALLVQQRDPSGVMVVLPADHLIRDTDLFLDAVGAALEMARREPMLITMGIRPSAPETGYGYIETGEPAATTKKYTCYRVKSFHEKPDRELAQHYVGMGNFYWNSGMFVWQAKVILEAIKQHLPGLHADLEKLRPSVGTGQFSANIAWIYPDLESISIDYGVMEKANNVLMIPADFGWNDLGTWATMATIWPRDDQQNAFQGGILALDSHRNVVHSEQRFCLLLGVDDLIVVDTEDALLICPISRAQDVGKALDVMAQRGMQQYL